ncbi:hypothetical protein BGZ59_004919 [Podila verticillata]|nr:hypothetical protein BGZ59_004919 [Podila verticillata]
MHLTGRQDDTSKAPQQQRQDPSVPTGARFDESDHSSDDDTDQDDTDSTTSSTTISMRFNTRPTMDLYDKLPPELLEHILTLLPYSDLFCCTTLSQRWARMVIPHLWHTPWMMYYVSWMKLLQTISYTSMPTSTSSSSSPAVLTSLRAPVQKCDRATTYARALNSVSDNDPSREPVLAWDNFSDHEDEDPSGLLRLAENQRRESVMVAGWEVLDRTYTSRTPFLHPNYGFLIRTLDFSELYYILSDKFLTHLFPHTPHLTTLIVHAPKQFSDASLYVLATCCRQLQRCELLGCDQISDLGVHFLLDHQQGSDALTGEGGGGGMKGSTMRVLSLANRSPITDGLLQHLAYVSFASKLERLNLANAVFVTGQDPGLATVFRCCTGLVALNVSHCQGGAAGSGSWWWMKDMEEEDE